MNDIQNFGLGKSMSSTRENRRMKLQKSVIEDNINLNAAKSMMKSQQAEIRKYEKESVLVNTIKAQEYEQNEAMRKKAANQQVLNYWKEQENLKNNRKKLEKEVGDNDANKPEVLRKALNQSYAEIAENRKNLQKELHVNEGDVQANPGDYKHFLNLQVEMKDLQKLKISKAKEEAAKQMSDHQKFLNDYEVLEKQRDRQVKDSYAKQLSQQITERNQQRERKVQYDEIDKEINHSYVKSLLKNKGDEISPIFFGGMPSLKYKDRKFDKRSNDSQFRIADNSSPDELLMDAKRTGLNRSAIENRVQLSGSVNLANPINSKIALSKKLNGGRNLINTGTNIIENTLKNQIKVVERIPSNIKMQEAATPNLKIFNQLKENDVNSFRRLGFDISPNQESHLGVNKRNTHRQSSIDYRSEYHSSQPDRNINRTMILGDGNEGSLLYPRIDREIIRNNKMDHIDSYIFNAK